MVTLPNVIGSQEQLLQDKPKTLVYQGEECTGQKTDCSILYAGFYDVCRRNGTVLGHF